jgi:hypothetical protein
MLNKMKNRIIYLMVLALAVAGLSGCEKETTAGLTRITYHAAIELEGDVVTVAKGTDYVEPGYKGTINGEDITSQITVTSTVDNQKPDVYSITYSAVNPDGYASGVSRTVLVYDPAATTVEPGTYTVSVESNRNGAKTAEYAKGNRLLIFQTAPGVFHISDLFGGYYDIGRGYGSKYATAAKLQLTGTAVSLIEAEDTPWGDTFASFSGSYDEASKTFTCTGVYAGYNFNLIIVKD